jgi:hypothetical protein
LNIEENFSDSFEYTKKLFSQFGTLIILIVLDIIPIVNWIVLGYAARVLKETPDSKSPPKLEKYSELFTEGAKVSVVSIIYLIIPIILIGAGVASFITAVIMGGGSAPEAAGGMFLFGATSVVLLLVGVLVAFLALIVLGAAIANMIKQDSFVKAFAFGEIFSVIREIGWGKYLVWVLLVAIIGFVVAVIAGAIPAVGWLIQIVISPALAVFFFRSLGLLYGERKK